MYVDADLPKLTAVLATWASFFPIRLLFYSSLLNFSQFTLISCRELPTNNSWQDDLLTSFSFNCKYLEKQCILIACRKCWTTAYELHFSFKDNILPRWVCFRSFLSTSSLRNSIFWRSFTSCVLLVLKNYQNCASCVHTKPENDWRALFSTTVPAARRLFIDEFMFPSFRV